MPGARMKGDCNKIGFNLLVGISIRIWHDGHLMRCEISITYKDLVFKSTAEDDALS